MLKEIFPPNCEQPPLLHTLTSTIFNHRNTSFSFLIIYSGGEAFKLSQDIFTMSFVDSRYGIFSMDTWTQAKAVQYFVYVYVLYDYNYLAWYAWQTYKMFSCKENWSSVSNYARNEAEYRRSKENHFNEYLSYFNKMLRRVYITDIHSWDIK